MKLFTTASLVALACVAMMPLTSSAPANNHKGKVTICHVPPGNLANGQTITIAESAAKHHFKEHADDSNGPCPCATPAPTPTDPTGPITEPIIDDGGWGGAPM